MSLLKLQGETIEEVIRSLDKIIEWSKENNSRLGYFAAIYRKVTLRVKEGIQNEEFEDGHRMERLDVIFANRYLEAVEQYFSSGKLTNCWTLAFDTSKKWRPIVLQHLLLGMNAHIELDLGIAASETVSREELPALKRDFLTINEILASLVNQLQRELARIWPFLKLLDRLAGNIDESLANFGMKMSRGRAWDVAVELSALPHPERQLKISELDQEVVKISEIILFQRYFVRLVLLF
ncbi:MAG: hypothetical protein GWN59_00020, partial [Calditrichae bacterium]|nr:hypothetical protein [Calditrichia bacterium]